MNVLITPIQYSGKMLSELEELYKQAKKEEDQKALFLLDLTIQDLRKRLEKEKEAK